MGLFFKEDKKAPPEKTAKKIAVTSAIPISIGALAATTIIGSSKTDYVAHLDKVMRDKNQPGLDYLEFADALKQLDNQPLQEQQKYIVTFPSYQSMGVTSDKLANSANYYISVLEKEKDDFYNELSHSKDVGITAKQTLAATREKEIAELTKQIQAKTAEIGSLNLEINNAQNTLQIEQNSFDNAYNNRVAIINSHIQKIQTYLNDKSING